MDCRSSLSQIPSDDAAIDGARSVLRAAEFVASPEESILAQLARLYVRAS